MDLDIEGWHTLILSDDRAARQKLDHLENENHGEFIRICHALLADPLSQVRDTALVMLGQRGDRDDAYAEGKALEALEYPANRHSAMLALGRIGSASVFPLLLAEASAGDFWALQAVGRQVRTDEQRQQVLAVARAQVLSPSFEMRERAVQILRQHSDLESEEEILLEAAQQYLDDIVLSALRHGTRRSLRPLCDLLASVPNGTREARHLARVIEDIERKG